jgi:CRISPR-associated endonuclease Csy4
MYYIEVTFRPTSDISLSFLWKKVFSRIHFGFVAMQNENGTVPLGIAFPEYSDVPPTLGSKFRIIAEDPDFLEAFNVKKCLSIFHDYVHISGSRSVPDRTEYVTYRRFQPQGNAQRIARRKAKRECISVNEALEKLKGFEDQKVSLPYIQLKSVSSGNDFSLFIKKEEADSSSEFLFNTYGLSKGGTVPEF